MSAHGRPRSFGVVIIDDDPGYAGLLGELVELMDRFELRGVATSVRDGLDLLSREQVELALVDVNMPDGGGPAVVEALQRTSLGPAVALISAQTPSDAVRRSGVAFVAKEHIDEERLLQVVRTAGMRQVEP